MRLTKIGHSLLYFQIVIVFRSIFNFNALSINEIKLDLKSCFPQNRI